MKQTARIVRLFRWLISAALTGAVLISVVLSGIGLTGQVRLRNELTGSMAPAIGVGDLVAYTRERADEARPGQIIVFQRAGVPFPITHRIVQASVVDGAVTLVTKGDASRDVDPSPAIFTPQSTIWCVHTVVPRAGALLGALTGRHGIFFILSLLPLFFGLPWLERMLREETDADADADADADPPTDDATATDEDRAPDEDTDTHHPLEAATEPEPVRSLS